MRVRIDDSVMGDRRIRAISDETIIIISMQVAVRMQLAANVDLAPSVNDLLSLRKEIVSAKLLAVSAVLAARLS